MRGFVIVRDGKVVMSVSNATAEDGFVGAPTAKGRGYVADGVLLERDGVKSEFLGAIKNKPSIAITKYAKYVFQPGVVTESGAEAVPTAEWDARQQAAADVRFAAALSNDARTGNNRKPGSCEECGVLLLPGYGTLRFCGADTGCVEHMDRDGWHITCADTARCAERKIARAAAAREERLANGRIHISSCGWGDYAPVQWEGDLRRPEEEIVAECVAGLKSAVQSGVDVDDPNQTVDQIAAKVRSARERASR